MWSVVCPGGVGHQGLPADLHLHRLAHPWPFPAESHHYARLLLSFDASSRAGALSPLCWNEVLGGFCKTFCFAA